MIPDDVDGIVVSFIVDDLEGALAEIRQAGLELLGDVIWAAEAFDEPQMEGRRLVLGASSGWPRVRNRTVDRLSGSPVRSGR